MIFVLLPDLASVCSYMYNTCIVHNGFPSHVPKHLLFRVPYIILYSCQWVVTLQTSCSRGMLWEMGWPGDEGAQLRIEQYMFETWEELL